MMLLRESKSYPFALKGSVPMAPGKTRIPSGHVRLFHYTVIGGSGDEAKFRAAESLRKNGIQRGKAKGHSYGEPDQVWASTNIPNDGMVFAEFSVAMDDDRILIGRNSGMSGDKYSRSGWDMTFSDSIKPREIVAVHEPWHSHYRYLKENPELISQVKAGEMDFLLDTDAYGPAVFRVKNELKESSFGTFERMVERRLRRSTSNTRRAGRLRSYRETAVTDRPYGAKTRDELPVAIPDVLYHATPFARKIANSGFKSRTKSGEWVLGGGSDDSISFTSDLKWATTYANGLRIAIEVATMNEFDPTDPKHWSIILRKHKYNPYPITDGIMQRAMADQKKYRYDDKKLSFEILQQFSFYTRQFPLFMGGSWPDSILRADVKNVGILEIDSEGPEWWSYHPGEKEFRIYDVENIGEIRIAG